MYLYLIWFTVEEVTCTFSDLSSENVIYNLVRLILVFSCVILICFNVY